MNDMKKRDKITIKDQFYELLNKAIKPLVSEANETKESRTSGDCNDKQTHQRKAEDAED